MNSNPQPLGCRLAADGSSPGWECEAVACWAATEPGWETRFNQQRVVALTRLVTVEGER